MIVMVVYSDLYRLYTIGVCHVTLQLYILCYLPASLTRSRRFLSLAWQKNGRPHGRPSDCQCVQGVLTDTHQAKALIMPLGRCSHRVGIHLCEMVATHQNCRCAGRPYAHQTVCAGRPHGHPSDCRCAWHPHGPAMDTHPAKALIMPLGRCSQRIGIHLCEMVQLWQSRAYNLALKVKIRASLHRSAITAKSAAILASSPILNFGLIPELTTEAHYHEDLFFCFHVGLLQGEAGPHLLDQMVDLAKLFFDQSHVHLPT